MLELFKSNFLLPMLGRVGTAVGAAVVTMGAQTEHANMVGVGAVGIGLVAFDLLSSWVIRKRAEGNK